MASVPLFGDTNQAAVTSQENSEKEEIGLASPRLGANNSNTKPRFVTVFLKTTRAAKKRKANEQKTTNKGTSGSVTL